MKTLTLWQRLDTALLLLIALLLAGAGLAFWLRESQVGLAQQSAFLAASRDRLCYDVLLQSETLYSLSLEPKSEPDKKRHKLAEEDLRKRLELLQNIYHAHPQLIGAARQLQEFALGFGPGSLGEFQSRLLPLAESEPASAASYWGRNYPGIARQREQLLSELSSQVEQLNVPQPATSLTLGLVALTGLLLLLLGALWVRRFQAAAIAQPLQGLLATLEKMRQGDFTSRLPAERQDEFGLLSSGLNRLSDDLCQLAGQVQRSGTQVNITASQIAANSKEQQSTAHEIAATTAEIGATSKEISATSRQLVKTMNEVNQVAEATTGLAGSGQTALTRMETTMRQLLEASGSINSKLAVLNEKTTNINSVVTTITKVADQTNLLSLNAAIEAEKAGEYGLGFAVVAMEIRRLADQTAVATYNIEKMVKEMQSAVAAGVMGMDKFSDEVRRGVEDVRQVSTQLAQIIHQVQTLSPRFQTVNEGMLAQANGAQQISETLAQLTEAAQQTAESMRQSTLAIEQLNGAARGLQQSVARFRLNPTEASLQA